MSKKIDKPIKLEKKTGKTEPKKNRINRLKNHKNNPVRFGFESLKPIEPNRFNQAHT